MSVIHFFQVINTTLLAFMSLFYLSKWIIVWYVLIFISSLFLSSGCDTASFYKDFVLQRSYGFSNNIIQMDDLEMYIF